MALINRVQVRRSGPLFRRGDRIVHEAAQETVEELVSMGETKLNEMLRPRPTGVFLSVAQAGKNASTGNYRANLHTMVKDLNGRIDDGGVKYGPWLEGVSHRNRVTRFKGYHSFRRTAGYLQQNVRKVARSQVQRALRRLRGGI